MEKFCIISINLLIIIFSLVCLSPKQLSAFGDNNTDFESLISFKHQLLKYQSSTVSRAIFMSSWNDTNKHFCSWEGVLCGRKHSNRVTALDLSSSGLLGPLPPSIVNLTFLERLDLSNNSLYGEIPPNLISNLNRLKYLNLSFNSFHGDISVILITNSSMLQVLELSNNQLKGKIPPLISSISRLNFFGLNNNGITGKVPPSIGNLSFLENLYVLNNHLEGSIPLEIGGLRKLKNLNMAENNLLGNIPSSLYNLSSLLRISLTNNHLSGGISANIAQAFPDLEIFFIAENHFIGSLDQVLQNVTSLVRLDVSLNNFSGVIPPDLGRMHELIYLNMQYNEFKASDAQDWRFLDSLTNCTSLEILALYSNNLGGMLPKSITNLSTELQVLTLGFNHILGSIPYELDRYKNLIAFGMEGNLLKGPIPESIGKLGRLQSLSFSNNRLTGIIPYSLGNLTNLNSLDLGLNQLTGVIPTSIQNLQILTNLDLHHNNLSGLVPRELFLIPSFSNYLNLSYNSFNGSLPLEVGQLVNLISLDFSNNEFSGEIPKSLGRCQMLLKLYMKYNFFHGSIPISLGNIKSLEKLDISHNNLSGPIPQFLQNRVSLKYLNLSFNNLEGEVPNEGIFANNSLEISLIGNEKLCGGIPKLHLPKCINRSSSIKNTHHLIKIIVPIFSGVVMLLVLLLCYILLYRKQKQSSRRKNSLVSSLNTPFPRISYAKLAKATNGFSNSYLVGYGRYGSVYKATLRDYQAIVAIKVFKLEVHGAFKSFTSECDALRSIRHRNLIKVLTSCSSIDHQGRDFKALIFEFMPKGNLDMWLHQEYEIDGDVVLSLEKRLNIMIDIADALEYLHHSCEPSIIHCDIKPSNILLDDNMIAHVGDFGLSRIFSEDVSMSSQDYSNKNEIKGTIGYIAPEYGGGVLPSSSADVYSFGIIQLEMLIGKRPTDDIFKDGLNIHNYVKMAFPHRINNIIDLKMFTEEQRHTISNFQSINKCLISLAEVALSCSASLPEERPSMRDVAMKLHAIRVSYLQCNGSSEFS
ncbi:receptor kinase-like protein Xa21 [Dendrobium catenatum]|uniref:Receptor kinase-like protein Xa21 n=1 Tax=Dendrobium catenatum TaxID=906689 RepID=A0A2I0W9J7_9ASPA|nr:receptor kinase-like protein Xa21 [Dendrobium catenatum]PKU72333.1 putative LRR receptor-like serine/threonine-protein kinase [Dendrobium catenatum]